MLGNEYSFFIFDFLLNLNKIAIFYIESGEKGGNSNISVLLKIQHK